MNECIIYTNDGLALSAGRFYFRIQHCGLGLIEYWEKNQKEIVPKSQLSIQENVTDILPQLLDFFEFSSFAQRLFQM